MIASDSDWEHDWAPATSGTLRGSEFFLYAQYTGSTNRDIDVFAYENGTHVEIYDVTAGTPVVSTTGDRAGRRRGPARPSSRPTSNEGEDLNRRFGLGKDIFLPGHVYQVVATKDVTALFGALDSVVTVNQARDGAGFVPGRSGHAIDSDFYFAIPHNIGTPNEQELRIVAGHRSRDRHPGRLEHRDRTPGSDHRPGASPPSATPTTWAGPTSSTT